MNIDDHFGRDFAQRVQDVFRLYVGHGKRISFAVLAERTGIGLSSLKDYASGSSVPGGAALLRLVAVLPQEAGDMLIEPCGYRLRPIDAEEDTWLSIGAEASMLTYELFDAQSDGRIDHREAEKLKARCRSLDAKLSGVLG